jgi:hypothetical protein
VAAVVGWALLAAACAGSPGQGTVTGTVRMYGGPLAPGGGMALNGEPLPNSHVSLWSHGHQVASATTDALGYFTLTLPAGTYDAVQACGAPSPVGESVMVAENQTTQHDISCQVP